MTTCSYWADGQHLFQPVPAPWLDSVAVTHSKVCQCGALVGATVERAEPPRESGGGAGKPCRWWCENEGCRERCVDGSDRHATCACAKHAAVPPGGTPPLDVNGPRPDGAEYFYPHGWAVPCKGCNSITLADGTCVNDCRRAPSAAPPALPKCREGECVEPALCSRPREPDGERVCVAGHCDDFGPMVPMPAVRGASAAPLTTVAPESVSPTATSTPGASVDKADLSEALPFAFYCPKCDFLMSGECPILACATCGWVPGSRPAEPGPAKPATLDRRTLEVLRDEFRALEASLGGRSAVGLNLAALHCEHHLEDSPEEPPCQWCGKITARGATHWCKGPAATCMTCGKAPAETVNCSNPVHQEHARAAFPPASGARDGQEGRQAFAHKLLDRMFDPCKGLVGGRDSHDQTCNALVAMLAAREEAHDSALKEANERAAKLDRECGRYIDEGTKWVLERDAARSALQAEDEKVQRLNVELDAAHAEVERLQGELSEEREAVRLARAEVERITRHYASAVEGSLMDATKRRIGSSTETRATTRRRKGS